ncbi:MAG TPA: acetolactate synthase small subunit [Myxococcaceae bacterium]|nr:acetolactate synthase small subunit [Myxococcaceae bacterium]
MPPNDESGVHTFVAYVEDKPGVLNRVISLFRRRGYNIESLNVGRTERPEVSQITLVVRADPDTARRLVANLYKLVNVLQVLDLSREPSVVRELALVRVRADVQGRAEVLKRCEAAHARVVNVTADSMTLELTDGPEKVDALYEQLLPLGSVEMVRTGAVAVAHGAPPTASASAASSPESVP